MTVKEIYEQRTRHILNDIYNEMFQCAESIFLDEFKVTLETLVANKYVRPFPYLKSIYVNYLWLRGIPLKIIAQRIKCAYSSVRYFSCIYDDNYKYIPEFKELADRFNKRLKEKENG